MGNEHSAVDGARWMDEVKRLAYHITDSPCPHQKILGVSGVPKGDCVTCAREIIEVAMKYARGKALEEAAKVAENDCGPHDENCWKGKAEGCSVAKAIRSLMEAKHE